MTEMDKDCVIDPIIKKKIRDEIKKSSYSFAIHLCYCRLLSFPQRLIDATQSLLTLRRLDLSCNNISEIPKEICGFVELRELWLQSNPLTTLPKEIENLTKLEVVDIKHTKVSDLPSEICNLKKLYELDFTETPFSVHISKRYGIKECDHKGLQTLKKIFQERYTRQCLSADTVEKLMGELYVKEADNPQSIPLVENMVELCNQEFTNLEEFRLFCRRADKLLPPTLAEIDDDTIRKSKEKFLTMRDDTRRDRMAAEVEIKLRCIYFDRIERSDVENVIRSIYKHVASLEDMQFLVKYASQVFPPSPDDANGELIWKNIVSLQEDLTNKRETAIKNLITAMGQLYPEQLPNEVASRGREIAKSFAKERFATKRELNSLTRLAVDSSQIFPPDFVSASASFVYSAAKQLFKQG